MTFCVDGGVAAAPLLGPVDGGPAAFVELALPGLAPLHAPRSMPPLPAPPLGVVVARPSRRGTSAGSRRASAQLVAERLVLGRVGEVHRRERLTSSASDDSVRRYRAPEPRMDFTFCADQDALRDAVRAFLAGPGADGVRAGDGRRRRAASPTTLWQPGRRPRLDRRCSCPRRTAGSASVSSTSSVVLEEMGRLPFPGPFFSSAVLATLAARRLGLDDLLASLAAGTTRGTVALDEAATATRSTACAPGPAARPAAGCSPARSRWCSTATPPTGCSSPARTQEGLGTFLVERPTAELVPTLDVDPQGRPGSMLDDDAGRAGRPAGDHTAIWRRVVDDARGRAVRRAASASMRAGPSTWRSSTPRCACSSTGRSPRSR